MLVECYFNKVQSKQQTLQNENTLLLLNAKYDTLKNLHSEVQWETVMKPYNCIIEQ